MPTKLSFVGGDKIVDEIKKRVKNQSVRFSEVYSWPFRKKKKKKKKKEKKANVSV